MDNIIAAATATATVLGMATIRHTDSIEVTTKIPVSKAKGLEVSYITLVLKGLLGSTFKDSMPYFSSEDHVRYSFLSVVCFIGPGCLLHGRCFDGLGKTMESIRYFCPSHKKGPPPHPQPKHHLSGH